MALTAAPAARRPDDDAPAEPALPDVGADVVTRLLPQVKAFRQQPVSPAATLQFEQQLQDTLRDLGRQVTQWTFNHLEPADCHTLTKHVRHAALLYTRLNRKTPQQAWTRFGPVRLWRVGSRATDKSGEPTLFPLALGLGLVQGATPALAERAAQLLGAGGRTQQRVLTQLRHEQGVAWGVQKLRQGTAAVSQAVAEQQHAVQVERVLTWLRQASASTGTHKPVLSVGRAGITLGVTHARERSWTGYAWWTSTTPASGCGPGPSNSSAQGSGMDALIALNSSNVTLAGGTAGGTLTSTGGTGVTLIGGNGSDDLRASGQQYHPVRRQRQ